MRKERVYCDLGNYKEVCEVREEWVRGRLIEFEVGEVSGEGSKLCSILFDLEVLYFILSELGYR